MQNNQGSVDLLEGLKQFRQTLPHDSRHGIMAFRGQILGVKNDGKEFVDTLLEDFNVRRKRANESLVKTDKIGEKVVADDDVVFLGLEFLPNFLKFFVDGYLAELRLSSILICEPFGGNTGEITACQSFKDPTETWKSISIFNG